MASLPSSNKQITPSTIRGLVKVPREVFHQVLDDLPVSHVLALSCRNIPYIDECIISNFHYQKVFRNLEELHLVRDYFRLYAEIITASFQSIHKSSKYLTRHPSSSRLTADELEGHLCIRIHELIRAATPEPRHRDGTLYNPTYLEALSALSPVPLTKVWDWSTFELLKQRWDVLLEATIKMNQLKSQQLLRMHDLLAAHQSILKTQLDPSQEPRPNVQHILNRLKWYSEELLMPKWSLGSGRVYIFTRRLTLVPYDRYLNLFLKVLEKYPLPDNDMPGITLPCVRQTAGGFRGRLIPVPPGSEEIEEDLKEDEEHPSANDKSQPGEGVPRTKSKYIHIPNLSDEQREGLRHEYTPEAVQKIRKAILGLKYVYTSTPLSDEPASTTSLDSSSTSPPDLPTATTQKRPLRTKHTPYSAHPENFAIGLSQPCFVLPPDNQAEPCYLFPEKEIEWLEAFVWSCAYMGDMDVKYNAKMTVKELWEKHKNL